MTVDEQHTHEAIIDLLGVYALDAVDADEREAVEAHLPSCPRCAAEVAEHREVAAQLANSGAPAPEGIWSRIVDSLEEAPPALDLHVGSPVVDLQTRAPERPEASAWHRLPMLAAAAALVVVGLVAGLALGGSGGDGPPPVEVAQPSLEDVARRALNDPDATTVTLAGTGPDGVEATAVVEPDGSGYLLGTTLPALDESQTYQLWGVVGDDVISLGILGNAPDVVAFHLDEGVQTLAVTAEVAGGVEASENDAVVAGDVS